MIPKNHVCRDCGRAFRHPRHLWDHRFDTGHGLPRWKATAKNLARVANQTRELAGALKATRSAMLKMMRTMGRLRTRRWARGQSR